MTAPRAPSPAARVARWLRAEWLDVLCVAVVVVMAVKLVWSVSSAHDLQLDDEAIQLERGLRLFHPGDPNGPRGLPPPDYGPVYSFWYALLHVFERDPIELYYASYTSLVVMTSAALYGASRALGAAPVAALVATFLLLVSRFPDRMPYAPHFATLLILAGCLLAARARRRRRALRWLLAATLLGTFVRPELALAFFLIAVAAAWLALRALRRGEVTRRAIAVEALGLGLAAGALLLVLGDPLGGGRAFFAFSQHYALDIVQRDHLSVSPWMAYARIVKQDFGDVTSVAGAARASPPAFARHVLADAAKLPASFAATIQPALLLGEGAARVTGAVAAVFAVAGGGAGAWTLWARRAREPRRAAALLALAAILATSSVSALLVYPREHYLLPPLALMLAFAGVGVTRLTQRLATRARAGAAPREGSLPGSAVATVATAALLAAIVPSPARGLCLQTALLGATVRPRPFPVLQTARTLAGFGVREHVVVLEPAWGYALYSGLDYARLHPRQKDRPFVHWLEAKGVGMVVLSDIYQQVPGFAGDAEYDAFLADPARFGFRIVNVPGSRTTRVAVRESLIHE